MPRGERQQPGAFELTPGGHIVEEREGSRHNQFLAGECGGGEFQCVEAGLGGWDEFAQARQGFEPVIVKGSFSRCEDYVDRQRDMGDGLDGIVDRSADIGFHTAPGVQQGEVVAVDNEGRTERRQDAGLGIGIGPTEGVIEGGEGGRLHRTGRRRHRLSGGAGGRYKQDQDGQGRVSEVHDRL